MLNFRTVWLDNDQYIAIQDYHLIYLVDPQSDNPIFMLHLHLYTILQGNRHDMHILLQNSDPPSILVLEYGPLQDAEFHVRTIRQQSIQHQRQFLQ